MGSSFHKLLYCFAIHLRSVCVWWEWGAHTSTSLLWHHQMLQANFLKCWDWSSGSMCQVRRQHLLKVWI